MQTISLNGLWKMREVQSEQWLSANVPGSVYADLLDNGKMDDPFWRDNEYQAFDLMEKDYLYARSFTLRAEDLDCDALLLHCEGLDTLAEVTVNGACVLMANNMHRTWSVNVLENVHEGENTIEILFLSPNRFLREAYANTPVNGTPDCTQGFPLLRKAHCMFGWDWGPRLPDAGIWRDISLQKINKAKFVGVRVHQEHAAGQVTLSFHSEIDTWTGLCECMEPEYSVRYTLTAPDGTQTSAVNDDITVEDPLLWWPNGYGEQPLYGLRAELLDDDGAVLDVWEKRIGLRTMTMRREKDRWGESFEACVNGVSVFSMGADYIPEDNILRRVTPQRTRRLLEDAKEANFNAIRVWGGGYYPDDWFYDACDELGLIVWQDFMFGCAMYDCTPEFEENIRAEFADNIRRLRHHASLGLWCGNNEMELAVVEKWYQYPPKQYADYIKMYEYIIPQELAEHDPDTFYWPASPSSGGAFDDPNDADRGDVHYWKVWHSSVPFTDYRKHFFRYASEFGFQSFPA
ncbi:MAG: glycoside hydrolase family 2 protein, partial [Eubacteriales bacterium]|nr:glycoside hydrolase family 2 protein [Eubacteriales bacterium]